MDVTPEHIDGMIITRRHFIKGLGLVPIAAAAGCIKPRSNPQSGVLQNDVHSRLNQTRVHSVQMPDSPESAWKILKNTHYDGRAIAIAGGRHAMGGQQFGANDVLIDTRRLSRVLEFDQHKGLVEVESGIHWPELMAWLQRAQAGIAVPWSIAQKQSGADRLSIGGAVAANVHGRGLNMRPIISDIESIRLLNSSGQLLRCSRTENPELFSLAAGGYGLFGFVTSVTLRLRRRQRLQRVVQLMDALNLMDSFKQRIAEGFLYGDFQFSTDSLSEDFLRKGIFSCYRPLEEAFKARTEHRRLRRNQWLELLHLAHTNPGRAFAIYSDYYLRTNGQLYWSDTHQMANYQDDYHAILDRRIHPGKGASEMITELYVPRTKLAHFLMSAGVELRRSEAKVIYGTVRLIERDEDSFLPWARDSFACVILNLCIQHTPEDIARNAAIFRSLIDIAKGFGGSYYLTYHRFASRDQVKACHPRFEEFLERKKSLDPGLLFQSDWYRHHLSLLERA